MRNDFLSLVGREGWFTMGKKQAQRIRASLSVEIELAMEYLTERLTSKEWPFKIVII